MFVPHPIRIAAALLAGAVLAGSPAFAEARIEREYDLQPGGRFVLDTDAGRVKVVGVSQDVARVTITSRNDIESRFDVDFDAKPNEIQVKVRRKGPRLFNLFGSGTQLEFEIEVPRRTELSIDTAGGSITVDEIEGETRLDTSGGSITVRSVRGAVTADTSGGDIHIAAVEGDVSADTSGGSIELEQIHGTARADTSGGSIEADRVAGDLHAETSGGSIRVEEAGGYVFAHTSGGRVSVSFAAANGSGGDLSTSGGGIDVALDPGIGLELDASTSGGSVTLDLPVTVQGTVSKRSVSGTVGGGGNLLKLRSSGGGIRVERR